MTSPLTIIAIIITLNVSAQNNQIITKFRKDSYYNSSFGKHALDSIGSGSWNSAFGAYTLNKNTSGKYNSAFGHNALYSNKTGNKNSAFGHNALHKNNEGSENSAFGHNALYYNETGKYNSAFGYKALYLNTSGSWNSAFGKDALYSNKTGEYNSALGYEALKGNTSGSYNTALGYKVLDNNTSGNYNTGLGYETRASKKDAENQTVIGYGATGQSDNSVTLGNSQVTAVYMGQESGPMAQNYGATVYAAGLNIDNTEYTAEELKQLRGSFLSSKSTDDGEGFGFKLSDYEYKNTFPIGNKAVDLSYSGNAKDGATGEHSLATGYNTTASEIGSTAMGLNTTASGKYSLAMGFETIASDYGSFVMGQYNVTNNGNAVQYNANNTAFVIGNGKTDTKYNAFKVLFNGDTTIGNNIIVNGDTTIGNNIIVNRDTINVNGKLFFDEKELRMDKLKLLDGVILSSVTKEKKTGFRLSLSREITYKRLYGDIGNKAVDVSYSYLKSSSGYTTEADNGAIGDYSLAMGFNTKANGYASTAFQHNTTASEIGSTAMGLDTTASGENSTAMGLDTTASGNYSTAFGNRTTASDYGSFVIGQYNNALSEVTKNDSATDYDPDNTAFVIGNGTDSDKKSDAFKVLFNGDATIGKNLTISGDIDIPSDVRLKANIASLGSSLYKLLLIDGKTYTIKKNGKQKIGVIAQDIQKVFPELVNNDVNKMLAVNYQGLIPILINAIKEQNDKISRLEHLIEKK